LAFGSLASSAVATSLSLLGSCNHLNRTCGITLRIPASIPVNNFENQQQDKATDTEPNKPKGGRPAEQNIGVRDIGVRPSFGAFNHAVPAGPARHDCLSRLLATRQ